MKTIRTNPIIFLFIFLFSLFSCTLSAQTTQKISYNPTILPSYDLLITAQLEAYPQEKIHLHTDRNVYVPGEKIWFKAYVVDAHSHLHPTFSQYVYVELISPADTLIQRVMIRQTNGMFHGHLPLSAVIPDGDYTLCAYTRHMENLGDDYFFKKNIRIENLKSAGRQSPDIRHQTLQGNRSRQGKIEQDDFDVSFFPEGGNLLEGIACKVAFKAINKKGYSETVSGKITDENGIELASVKTYHAGMGFFVFQPQQGQKYYLKCVNENGFEKQFELPRPNVHAWSLAVSMPDKRVLIGAQKSVHAPDIPCYLLVHCRGAVLYFSELDIKQIISLKEEELPAGVIQIVLFDGQMNPLSERLIFSKNDASAHVEFRTEKEVYEKREKVAATLFVPDSIFYSFNGHFSIAVTDDKDIAVDESTTILSSLLLSSELKGYIENPAYYLHDDFAMDLLMMTHGWRRYNVPEVVKGNLEAPHISFQKYQEISGMAESLTLLNRAIHDIEVSFVTQEGGFGVTTTNENGSFVIPELFFPDSTDFYIQILDGKGRDNIRIVVNDESFPALQHAPQTPVSKIAQTTDEEIKNAPDGVYAFLEKAEERAKYDEDIRAIEIEEVTITAPRLKKPEPRDEYYLNKSSDFTITREQIDEWKFNDVKNYLYMIPNLNVYDDVRNRVYVLQFGGGSPYPPLIFVDGIQIEDADLYCFSVDEIESIDAIKFSGASLLGTRGAGGAISNTTRRGGGADILKYNKTDYNPLGYQKPAEFYSPKYETLDAKRSVIPDYRTTIFWKPDVVISEEGEVSFEFYTADSKTTYSVVIEGITNDGRMVRQVEKIRIE